MFRMLVPKGNSSIQNRIALITVIAWFFIGGILIFPVCIMSAHNRPSKGDTRRESGQSNEGGTDLT